MMQGGLREYIVDGKEERRTFDGCDMNQQFNNPTLFIFAYDWRRSNAENAGKLKQYVECVQRFYPGTKVNIVAHSMGGLLARRYITQFPTTNSVNKLITVASPFLGATKAIQAMETGRLGFLSDIIEQNLPAFATNPVKILSINSPAVQELLPSEAFFTLGGSPFVERVFDAKSNGIVNHIYDYPNFFSFYNARFGSVYSTNQNFHSFQGQDNWSQDTSGVQYFHILGRQSAANTTERVIATPVMKNPRFDAKRELRIRTKKGIGDGTVPNLSAERCQNEGCESGLDFNENAAEIIKFIGENKSEDKLYSHVGLVKSLDVRTEILTVLGLPFQLSTTELARGEQQMKIVTRNRNGATGAILPPLKQAYYFSISGIGRIKITDNEGNTNTSVGDAGFEVAVPGVSYSGGTSDGNGTYQELTMPAEEGEYTLKFTTGADSIDIELARGVGDISPNYAVRYTDLILPANVECLLTINAQGMEDLRHDSNGDGTFDTVVPAHVRVTGTAAQDVTAPNVSISQDTGRFGTKLVTINAADTESGVKTIYYRYAGDPTFQIYTEPFYPRSLPRNRNFVIEAFADDNVGNRSSPIQGTVTNAGVY